MTRITICSISMRRVTELLTTLGFRIERLLLGRSLTSLFRRRDAHPLHLVLRSTINLVQAASSSVFARAATDQGLPIRVQTSILLAALAVGLLFVGGVILIVAKLDVVDIHYLPVIMTFCFAGLSRIFGEVIESGDENIEESISKLVATDGVVQIRSEDQSGEPVPQTGSPQMNDRQNSLPFTFSEFEQVVRSNSANLEAKTAASVKAIRDDYDRSDVADKLEFHSPSSSSKARR